MEIITDNWWMGALVMVGTMACSLFNRWKAKRKK